ncbi:MAG: glycosyltransferase family 4 protein [Anaerovoracaceae bacterium]
MNILIINHYAGSPKLGMEFRPYYLAKEWVKQGHKVLIVGATYSHLRKMQPSQFGEEVIDGIGYYWVKTNEYKGNGIGRIISMFLFVFKLWLQCGKLGKKIQPDVVIASSTYPLDIYPAHKIAKRFNAKLIFEVHDLWPLSPMLIGGYSKFHPFIIMLQFAENYAYKYSHKVVSLLWNAKKHMISHGMAPHKFIYIPNGYVPSEWEVLESELPKKHAAVLNGLKHNNKFIIGFAGGFAESGAIEIMLQAGNILREQTNIVFVLVGKGIKESSYREFTANKKLDNIIILPAVEKKQVPLIVDCFDVAYLGGLHSILHQYGTSPNKLTDYMLAAKPILFSIDEPDSLVERLGCGICVEAENIKQLANAIMKFSGMSVEERMQMGNLGKKYAEDNLQYRILANKFLTKI